MDTITSEEGINRAIGTANYNIENFQNEKERYEKLKNKIQNEVIPTLTIIKNNIAEAKQKLKDNYVSDNKEVKEKINQLQERFEEIDTMIKVLKKHIVLEIAAKIHSLNYQIENEQSNIKKYNNMLNK